MSGNRHKCLGFISTLATLTMKVLALQRRFMFGLFYGVPTQYTSYSGEGALHG